jgi:DNA polymerase III epsilon subunit-like protein
MKSARDFTESYLELTELNEFVVVDVETTLAADGNGFRVVSIALVPVVKGSIKTGKTFLVNPQQPIDADSIRIHHITDAQVAGRLTFSSRIPAINKFLDRPGVVFVAHSASFDAGVLRSEYERAGRTMPDLPVLDTMVLPRQLGMNSFGFERTGKHSALPDAKAAARCLTELLYKAAANGYRDLRRLLADHDRGTTLTVPQLTGIRTRPEAGPDLTPEHLASHAARLPEAPNEAELDEWADAAVECAKLRCALLSGRAAVAVEHAGELRDRIVSRLPLVPDPGDAATLVGALAMTAEHSLDTLSGEAWWYAHGAAFAALPACVVGRSCPDCRESRPCPLDVLHQSVARAVCYEGGTSIKAATISRMAQDRGGRSSQAKIKAWCRQGHQRLAGHAAWLIAKQMSSDGNPGRASRVLDFAVTLGLDAYEPRLALDRAQALALRGKLTDAEAELAVGHQHRTSDAGYELLDNWQAGFLEGLLRSTRKPPRVRVRTEPRNSRPISRTRPSRFK